ncbi:hypothetical protein SDB74_12255, partial [Legionella pneumophila serogroup 1]
DFSLPSLKIERSVYTLNPFQKITILIRFQSISRAFDNFHSLIRERIKDKEARRISSYILTW